MSERVRAAAVPVTDTATAIRRADLAAVGPVNQPTVRAICMQRGDQSRQLDESSSMLSADDNRSPTGLDQLPPPFSVEGLALLYDRSNTLQQCVEAMVTNIAGYGHKIVPIAEGVVPDPEEVAILTSFLQYANGDDSLLSCHKRVVNNQERYGYAFLEVIRDTSDAMVAVRHIKSRYVRLLRKKGKTVTVTRRLPRGRGTVELVERKKFRRYVQEMNGRRVYFKEFGDPRPMDYETGEYGTREKQIPMARRATELIHFRFISDDEYGVPCWVQQTPSILGSREAEETNWRYFTENMIPAALLTVAGGRLTDASYKDIVNLVNGTGGRDRQNKIVLIEALGVSDSVDGTSSVNIKLDKLQNDRPSDQLFGQYDKDNQIKQRSAFRLPPSLVGLSQDVTFATANVASAIAETQVFAPRRAEYDDIYNRTLINSPLGLNLRTVKLASNVPVMTNPDQILKTLIALNAMGGLTPRKAVEYLNETMGLRLDPFPEEGDEGWEEWMDRPLALALREANAANNTTQGDEDTSKTDEIREQEKGNSRGPENGQQ